MEKQPELNQEYVVQSLTNQVANLSLGNAQKDSVIASQQEELQKLQQELGQFKTEEKAKGGKKEDAK